MFSLSLCTMLPWCWNYSLSIFRLTVTLKISFLVSHHLCGSHQFVVKFFSFLTLVKIRASPLLMISKGEPIHTGDDDPSGVLVQTVKCFKGQKQHQKIRPRSKLQANVNLSVQAWCDVSDWLWLAALLQGSKPRVFHYGGFLLFFPVCPMFRDILTHKEAPSTLMSPNFCIFQVSECVDAQ